MQFIDLKTQYQRLRDTINLRIQAVLDHGQFIMGPEVKELEAALCAYTGAKHCITVASGTEALLISLMALGVKAGDEVITTSFTFVATAEVIALLGAKPVFVDVEPDTCNIKVSEIEAKITPRTKAIIPVSLYGQCGDMDEVNAVAARHGLPVIEDAAQSFGATYKGRKSCNLSTIGCTSFFPSKPLGCYGDGGALFTNDDELAQAMRAKSACTANRAATTTPASAWAAAWTRCNAPWCWASWSVSDWEIAQRIKIGARYQQLLADLPGGACTVTVRPDRDSVWAQFTVMVPNREAVIAQLKEAGIPTAVHYPRPIHAQPAYEQYAEGAGATPVSDDLARAS